MATIGKEINALTIENCVTLRKLRLPMTMDQQDWIVAEADRLRSDLNSASVVLKMRGDKIAKVLELIQEFNDNGWHDGAGDDLADVLKGEDRNV